MAGYPGGAGLLDLALHLSRGRPPRGEGETEPLRPLLAVGLPQFVAYARTGDTGLREEGEAIEQTLLKNGLEPVGIYVEDKYVRAVRGGVGFTKTGGNYAASILAGAKAEEKGYEQVLWLDGKENKYIEEVGSMNMFFKFKDALVTPPLLGSILGGITRDSIIKLARHMGVPVEERRITVQDVFDAADRGELDEAFGSGTAAVVSPVGRLAWEDKEITISGGEIGPLTQKFYDTLTGIQFGTQEDPFGWVLRID